MGKKKLRFAIFGNTYQARKSAAIQGVAACLRSHGSELLIDRALLDLLMRERRGAPTGALPFDGDAFEADFAVSLGGDGTFLKTAVRVAEKETPIIGVNTGRLGFLADVLPGDIETAFAAVYAGDYIVERHAALSAATVGHQIKGCPNALNDIAVLKRDNAAMITIHAAVNGRYLVTYQADGLIVSTSTGSTAYSLSNGGPIIVPGTDTVTLTPVAPHSLSMRPIVMRGGSEITLRVESRSHNYLVAIDGRSETLPQDTAVVIRRAPFMTNIVRCCGRDYFQSLREKMHWGDDPRG